MDKTVSLVSGDNKNSMAHPSPDNSLMGICIQGMPSLLQTATTVKKVERMVDYFDQSTTTGIDDTVHYLSPASPFSPRTVCEGDLGYELPSFMKFLHEYHKAEPYGSVSSSTVSCVEPELQRTIQIIKPEAMQYKDTILRAVTQAGFSFISMRTLHLTPEQVSEIYTKYYGSPAFPHIVITMSVGPVLTLSLAAINAVEKLKSLVGPEKSLHAEWFYPMSMRVRFGLLPTIQNAVHVSETYPQANFENRYFYADSILEPIITEQNKATDYIDLNVNPTLLNGLAEVVRVKPVDPILYLAEWLLLNNPYQPRLATQIAILPT